MGLPYSKQIHAAFNQVTPLVAAGFEVLETTKNIAILLAWIEVLTLIILALILAALTALLITTNPDLENERKTLVTPVMKWIAQSVENWVEFISSMNTVVLQIIVGVLILGTLVVWLGAYWRLKDDSADEIGELDLEQEEAEQGTTAGGNGDGKDSKEKEDK